MKEKFKNTYLNDILNNIAKKLYSYDFKIIDYSIGKPIEGDDSLFVTKYLFQPPCDTIKFRCGTCWDITCVAYYEILNIGITPLIFYYESDEHSNFPANHMFLILKIDNDYYSFDASWKKFLGLNGPFKNIQEIFNEYAKEQILMSKGIEIIKFYNVLKFPNYLIDVKTFMIDVKSNPLVYRFSIKKYFNDKSFKRKILESSSYVLNKEQKYTLNDLIFENEFQSSYFLKEHIKNKIQKINLIEYSKNDLKKFIDKNWKYFNEFNSINDSFKLTIIECDENDIELFTNLKNINVQGKMCEFCDLENILHEYIWIKKDAFSEYDDSFLILLNHELGHVWTSIFGYSLDNFEKGRTKYNNKDLIPLKKFNQFQMDVFLSFYNGKYDLLLRDYNYILKNDEVENWELTTNSDEIIEVLVNDYLTYHSDESTKSYILNIFNKLESKNYSFKDFTLLKIYKNFETFEHFNDSTYIRNIIRRLFLIFAFGNLEQREYFKNLCFDEFKKV